ncbi:PIR Superfamily Protein [Plasmodium malariae]|uniref:PIR Superfamily Protein n=1 Tax=Plasmodium malariae TaxID=5858 RepID=A0A1A8X6T2_PLAMA|nr:PIR Superfamily Protein [Plasmodium malariae]
MSVEQIKRQLYFLEKCPEYNFDKFRGIVNENYRSSKCKNGEGLEKHENIEKCVKLHTILDDLENILDLSHGKFSNIWNNFRYVISPTTDSDIYSSTLIDSFIDTYGKIVEDYYVRSFNKYKNLHGTEEEVIDTMMLYYFVENIENINKIIRNANDKNNNICCWFINHCLAIVRKYQKGKCSSAIFDKSTGSTVCREVNNFLAQYKEKVLPVLNSEHNITARNPYSITDAILCSSEDPFRNNFYSFFRSSSELTKTGKGVITVFSIFGVFLILFFLYKFTPLSSYINPRFRRTRRIWRNIERNAENKFINDDSQSEESARHIPNYMDYTSSSSSQSLY